MPGTDGHYKKFSEVFQTITVKNHRPSLQNITKKCLPFYPSVQHVKNCNKVLLCDECGMWRLIYATKEKTELNELLDGMSFSCGVDLQEAELPDALV